MTMITIFNPDGTKTVRKATKADDDRFYAAYSNGVDKGQLTVLRSQPQKPEEPRPAPARSRPKKS